MKQQDEEGFIDMKKTKGSIYLGIAFLSAVLMLLSPGLAAASTVPPPIIDFRIPGNTGQISYSGGNSPLVGTGIAVDWVEGWNTPLNAGPGNGKAVNATLSFTTGALSSHIGNTWVFGPGGQIGLFGTITDIVGVPTTLLSGVIQQATVTQIDLGVLKIDFMGMTFSDNKIEALHNYFGLTNPFLGAVNLSFFATVNQTTGAFESYQVGSGNIQNMPVPIPPTAYLLASGLLGLIGFRRKFFA